MSRMKAIEGFCLYDVPAAQSCSSVGRAQRKGREGTQGISCGIAFQGICKRISKEAKGASELMQCLEGRSGFMVQESALFQRRVASGLLLAVQLTPASIRKHHCSVGQLAVIHRDDLQRGHLQGQADEGREAGGM